MIPPDALFPEEEEREAPLWMKFLRNLFSIERARFTDREEERRIEEIKKRLAGNLKVWLSLIKERLETEGDGRH